jgi:hypothetical protein
MKQLIADLRLLAVLLSPFRRRIAALLGLAVVQVALFAVVDPIALKLLIDAITEGNAEGFVLTAVIVVIAATIGRLSIYGSELLRKSTKIQFQLALT